MTAYPSTLALLHRLQTEGVATGLATAGRNADAGVRAAVHYCASRGTT